MYLLPSKHGYIFGIYVRPHGGVNSLISFISTHTLHAPPLRKKPNGVPMVDSMPAVALSLGRRKRRWDVFF